MVHVRDSPTCAICEFVMKQLDSMLVDHTTEVCGCIVCASETQQWCQADCVVVSGGGEGGCGEGVHIPALHSLCPVQGSD